MLTVRWWWAFSVSNILWAETCPYVFFCPKPKFLTKEERTAEALRKRQQEADEIRQRMEEEKKKRTEFGKEASKAFDDVRKMDKDQDRDKEIFR